MEGLKMMMMMIENLFNVRLTEEFKLLGLKADATEWLTSQVVELLPGGVVKTQSGTLYRPFWVNAQDVEVLRSRVEIYSPTVTLCNISERTEAFRQRWGCKMKLIPGTGWYSVDDRHHGGVLIFRERGGREGDFIYFPRTSKKEVEGYLRGNMIKIPLEIEYQHFGVDPAFKYLYLNIERYIG